MRTSTAVTATVRSFPIAHVPAIEACEHLDHYLTDTPDLIEAGYADDSAAPARKTRLVDLYDRQSDRPTGRHALIETIVRFASWCASHRTLPTRAEVEARYGVSRSTACRWLSAIRSANAEVSA